MSVNTQNNSRLRKIEEMKDKMNYCGRQCSTLMELLKQRGIDISGLVNMGLSSEEMSMISNYFTFKNEQINISCDVKLLENEEMDSQTRNRELNQQEADRRISERKREEENYREQKIAENKYAENNRSDYDHEL